MNDTPLEQSRAELRHIIDKIASDSSVGIDTQLTHAVIIAYLQNMADRMDRIERKLNLQD